MPATCRKCGHTHLTRYDTPACTGHRSADGAPCRNAPRDGQKVCGKHGGNSPQALARVARDTQRQKAEDALATGLAAAFKNGVPPHVDPAQAMLDAVSWKHAEVVALRLQVAELDEDEFVWGTTRVKEGGEDRGTTEEAKPHLLWVMLRSAEDQLVKFAAAARAAGVDERRVQIAEQQGAILAGVIKAVLDRLQLTPAQLQRAPTIVAEQLRSAGTGGDAT